MAPQQTRTARDAWTWLTWPSFSYSMPLARLPSIRIRRVRAFVVNVRFVLFNAGFRWATAALQRRPLRVVLSRRAMPSGLNPFRSSEVPCPDCSPARSSASKSGFSKVPRVTPSGPLPPRQMLSPRSEDSQRLKYGRHCAKVHSASPNLSAQRS